MDIIVTGVVIFILMCVFGWGCCIYDVCCRTYHDDEEDEAGITGFF